jgi:WD40 repeat protein
MKQSRKTIALLAAVLVLVILLFFANKIMTKPSPQAARDTVTPAVLPTYTLPPSLLGLTPAFAITSTPIPPDYPTHVAETVAAMPTISPTATSTLAPPACIFPLAEIKTEDSKPENYTFSEPQVVLNDSYNLVEWLPDNQRLLMTELSDQIVMGKPPTEIIELYNPTTGEIKVYATHTQANGGLPAWLPELNAVVYPVMNFMGIDKKTYYPIFTRQLWVSYGDPDTAQMLADNMSQFPIAVKPDGSEALYLADKKLFKLDKSLKKPSSIPFDPERWDYGKGQRNQDPIFYKMAWQPNTSLVFLYSSGGASEMGGYTFIMDADSGKVCELNFSGLWARKALWSPDGRYLAIIRATAYSTSSGGGFDMTVLDAVTGELHTTEVLPPSVETKRYVDNFVWAPDNRHLLAVGTASSQNKQNNGGTDNLFELYLVDFMAGQSISVLPDYSGFFTPNLAWSPDGTKLAIDCTLNGGYRLCLISVNASEN